MKKVFVIVFSLTMVLVLNSGCGTDSGNPGLSKPSNDCGGENCSATGGENVSALLESLCATAQRCISYALPKCLAETLKIKGLPDVLGAPQGLYPSAVELIQAINAGQVKTNSEAMPICRRSILDLNCDHSLVRYALEGIAKNDYSKTSAMFEVNSSCRQTIK